MRWLTRFRRQFAVWLGGRWRDRYVRCYTCGAVSVGQRIRAHYPGFVVRAKYLGCGHEVQPARYGFTYLRLAKPRWKDR